MTAAALAFICGLAVRAGAAGSSRKITASPDIGQVQILSDAAGQRMQPALCGLFSKSEPEKRNWPGDSSVTGEDLLSIIMHQPYIESIDLDVNYKKERLKIPGKIIEALGEDPVSLKEKDGFWFGEPHFSITREEGDYCYYGKIKNNKPSGFGVLTEEPVDPDDYSDYKYIIYAGNFKKGTYSGYGVAFKNGTADAESEIAEHVQSGKINENCRHSAQVYLESYAVYDGHWKKGRRNGEGNIFRNLALISSSELENYWGGALYPLKIEIADVNPGIFNSKGKVKIYNDGLLTYDGGVRNWERSGKGTSYFKNGQEEYVGKWKKGKYNGKGKLYDENGTLIYSGKWKDGDYAS